MQQQILKSLSDITMRETKLSDDWGPGWFLVIGDVGLFQKLKVQRAKFWAAIAMEDPDNCEKQGAGLLRGYDKVDDYFCEMGNVPGECREMLDRAMGIFPQAKVTGVRKREKFDDEIPF